MALVIGMIFLPISVNAQHINRKRIYEGYYNGYEYVPGESVYSGGWHSVDGISRFWYRNGYRSPRYNSKYYGYHGYYGGSFDPYWQFRGFYEQY